MLDMRAGVWVVLLVAAVLLVVTVGSGPSDRVRRIALAIARAEGFYVAGSISQTRHNPGNITDTSGTIRTYLTDADGWAALHDYIERVIAGRHPAYPAGVTIAEAARIYTATQQAEWAYNVAAILGVSQDTPLAEV